MNQRPDARGDDSSTGGRGRWAAINGSESVIVGDLSTLADGEPVRLAQAAGGQ